MAKYRKKPVVIEAELWTGHEGAIDDWFTEAEHRDVVSIGEPVDLFAEEFSARLLLIKTLGGVITAQPGDWIIRGIGGELYPCKPDIFAATYEPA